MNAVPAFYVNDGKILYNVNDLRSNLINIREEVFSYHVNEEKNDFAEWIENGLKDRKLAQAIKKIKTRKGLLKKLETVSQS